VYFCLGKFWFKAGKFFSLLGNSPFGEILGWPISLIFYVLSQKKISKKFFFEIFQMRVFMPHKLEMAKIAY